MNNLANKIVTVVIVTCGRLDYLKPCLVSVRKQSYNNLEVIVINNNYNQGLEREIAGVFPEVSLHSNFQDPFYCSALNLGIGQSKGEFILCLNDDVILDERFIENALRGFSADKKIGMVSGKLLRSDRKTIDSAGLSLSCWRTARERGYGNPDISQFDEEGYIFGVNGAAAFYSKKMLDELKSNSEYFDSDFRIFYEDLDIAWRAQSLGWRGYYIPSAIAYHIRGATVREPQGIGKPFARRYLNDALHLDLIKNRYRTIIKNESFRGFLIHFPCIILYDLAMWSCILIFRPRLIKLFFEKILKKT